MRPGRVALTCTLTMSILYVDTNVSSMGIEAAFHSLEIIVSLTYRAALD